MFADTNQLLMINYAARQEMLEGYIKHNKYAMPGKPGRHSTREDDDRELTEIEFKLHVLKFIENAKKILPPDGPNLREVLDLILSEHLPLDQAVDDLERALKQADISFEGKHAIWVWAKRMFETQAELYGATNRIAKGKARAYDESFVNVTFKVRREAELRGLKEHIQKYYPEDNEHIEAWFKTTEGK